MIVSYKWLKEYIPLTEDEPVVSNRLAMSGLNHEGSEPVGDDIAVDLEVTSNRPDCLGHIGVAREIAALYDLPLTKPSPEPATGSTPASDVLSVAIEAPELCSRYTARVIRGVKIGPSPAWLVERLATIGVKPVNNVVDITNYVMMECSQPLHAFDLAKLKGKEKQASIIVRKAAKGEKLEAIDHHDYPLDQAMCVIADAEQPIALAGVMGGASSEVSDNTTDLVIESADFAPLSVRTTARQLKLHSPSSFRFERGVDPIGIDWASRRCCQLILDIAGGELLKGVCVAGDPHIEAEPVTLRLSQLSRILGISIPSEEVQRILIKLGCIPTAETSTEIEVQPPTWRRDLTREIDLVEEIARIHGYDQIPEDVGVPMAPSHRSDYDRVVSRVRHVLNAAGFDETLTASVVPEKWSDCLSPWTSTGAIQSSTPMLRGADRLRRSLLPSLLEVRRINESLANAEINLFETAKVYLPKKGLPEEPVMLGLASDLDFHGLKGVVEALLTELNPAVTLSVEATELPLLHNVRTCKLLIDGELLGFLGEVGEAGRKEFSLRSEASVAELRIDQLERIAQLSPQFTPLSNYPAITQDLNFIVAEEIPWADLEATVRSSAGEELEQIEFREIYRDEKKDGAKRKRLLLTFTLRAADRTLTGEEAEAARNAIIEACGKAHRAELVV